MTDYVLLLAPSANHVYADQSARLAAAESSVVLGVPAEPVQIAGVEYLGFTSDELDSRPVAELSATLALFERREDLLRPIELPQMGHLGTDLVTIPKYPGKTNEQFTRLLLNVTLAACQTGAERPTVLDPMCGRATTLLVAWTRGLDGYGVEADEKSVEAFSAYLKTYLRRKRMKHAADLTPVRRDGRSIGRRFDAEAKELGLEMTVFTGDTRDSAKLYGKKRFDVIVTDAPYGVVHGSRPILNPGETTGRKDRSPAGLLAEAVPVWASQLKPGGALGISWNTHGLSRAELVRIMIDAGLTPQDEGPWREFDHRVDASIQRDLLVGVAPR